MKLYNNNKYRIVTILIFLLIQKHYAQVIYSFSSSPSFHHGFVLNVDKDKNMVAFKTENIFYFLDTLKKNNTEIPNYHNKIMEKNNNLLPNSIFEKSISADETNNLINEINTLKDNCKKTPEKGIDYDGIVFKVSNNKYDSCDIWNPSINSEVNNKIILNILNETKKIFYPNTIVDKYIFDSKIYLEENKSFEILSESPLYLKLYEFPSLGCINFESQINELSNNKEIFIDITDFRGTQNKDCIIEILNKKFKKVIIIQNKEYDFFNE